MTDSPSSDGPEREDTRDEAAAPSQVPKPAPVRPSSPPDAAGGGARPTIPKPVRAGLERTEEPTVEVPEREVELPDVGPRLVRVRGRSRGHTSQGAADLLLLGFHRPGEEEPEREVLVVGDDLEALTALQLEAAWERSREARDPFEPTELFPDTTRSRGRGR